jgi:hypothetical protein
VICILAPLRGEPCVATNKSQRLNAEVKVKIKGDGQECPSRSVLPVLPGQLPFRVLPA